MTNQPCDIPCHRCIDEFRLANMGSANRLEECFSMLERPRTWERLERGPEAVWPLAMVNVSEHPSGIEAIIQEYAKEVSETFAHASRCAAIEQRLATHDVRLTRLEHLICENGALHSLANAAFTLLKPIPVHFTIEGEDASAAFLDANIHAAGDTKQEAFEMLRELVVDTFDYLDGLEDTQLGVMPRQQLKVLREFVKRA